MALTDKLTAIADAIRTKTGSSDTMTLDEMATAVGNITGDGETTTVTTDSADAVIDRSITEYSSGTLTSIGDYAFYYCTSLANIDTPYVTSIDTYAFQGCTSLASIDLSNTASIGNYAFYGCSILDNIDTSKVASIGFYAFYDCTSLSEIDLSVCTSAGNYAFANCTALTSLDFIACESIGLKTCYKCKGLTKVWLPSTCTAISAASYSNAPFYQCSSTLKIYTDVTDEDSIPSGWGAYWNYYGSSSTLTVHYGATHDEYEAV